MCEANKHRLLILGSLIEFVPLVERAKSRGYYTIVCDGYHGTPAKKVADISYDIDVRDVDAIVKMCKEESVDGIIGSFSDLLFEQITKIAAKAGLKWYATPDMIPCYREKPITKQILQDVGVRVPKRCTLEPDFKDSELDGLQFPLVIKPVNGYGSKGIFVVHSVEEIRSRYDEVVARSEMKTVLAEEYSAGAEYNLMTWIMDGEVRPIGIANREKNPQVGEHIPEHNRLVYPAVEASQILGEATAVVKKFIDKTGQREGPLSMQFFYNEHGVEVCEIAGRFFGYEHDLVTLCTGFDYEELLLNYVYNPENIPAQFEGYSPIEGKPSAGIYYLAKLGKKIKDMSSIYKLAEDKHVKQVIYFYEEGDTTDSFLPYAVRVYLSADSYEELDRVTEAFYEQAHIYADNGEDILSRFQIERRN